jgi:hypothetical protein
MSVVDFAGSIVLKSVMIPTLSFPPEGPSAAFGVDDVEACGVVEAGAAVLLLQADNKATIIEAVNVGNKTLFLKSTLIFIQSSSSKVHSFSVTETVSVSVLMNCKIHLALKCHNK